MAEIATKADIQELKAIMEGVTTALKDHKADMDTKIKQLQVAISVKIDNEMANFVNQNNAVSDILEILEKTEKERSVFEPDTTIGLS